jgi:hypothetical protein
MHRATEPLLIAAILLIWLVVVCYLFYLILQLGSVPGFWEVRRDLCPSAVISF